MNAEEQPVLANLIRGQRWAALATLSDGAPMASMVAYVAEEDFSGFLLHLSRLAPHTRNLLAVPRASLVISEPDLGQGDPQLLARVAIQGTVVQLPRNTAEYASGREHYLARLPGAEQGALYRRLRPRLFVGRRTVEGSRAGYGRLKARYYFPAIRNRRGLLCSIMGVAASPQCSRSR